MRWPRRFRLDQEIGVCDGRLPEPYAHEMGLKVPHGVYSEEEEDLHGGLGRGDGPCPYPESGEEDERYSPQKLARDDPPISCGSVRGPFEGLTS